ncbi:MAG: tetratricopeptide repeat protein [Nitrospirae bacterium]|nr:tetratricopeptide repeat protein [Nitrospirota bacterium]
MAKVQEELYKRLAEAETPQQRASVEQAVADEREAERQKSLRAQQVKREPIPVPLPKLRGLFVDREAEQDTLRHCLRQADNQIVVIIAPAGFGKTELTTKVLQDIAPFNNIATDYVQGIMYIRCAKGAITLGNIFTWAGRITGESDKFVGVYANKDHTLPMKLDFFFKELSKIGSTWLVMDNFEDMLDPDDDTIIDAELREFLETAAAIEHKVRLIITSRTVPKFKGSRNIKRIDLSAGLPEDYAIRYLREEGAEYGLGGETEETLRSFVTRVHGIPMALVSVLGYLEGHRAKKLNELLEDKSLFMSFDRHDYKEGLKSLLLQQIKGVSLETRLVLSVLSIFSGPASFASIHYLLQGVESDEFDAILTRLEKNRLTTRNGGNYDMHPFIRSFVYEMIPENEPAGDRKGSDREAVLTRSELHKKAAEFFEKLRKPETEWKTIADLDPQLQEIHHLMRAGHYEEAVKVLNIIDFDYLQLWGNYRISIELRELFTGKLKDTYLANGNTGSLGWLYLQISRMRESLLCLEQALRVAKESRDRRNEGAWLGNLGRAYSVLGDTGEAIEHYEQALAIAKEIGDRCNEGISLGSLGNAYSTLGETDKAIEYFEQALDIARETGDRRSERGWLGNLGKAYKKLGETDKATEYFEQASTIKRELGE